MIISLYLLASSLCALAGGLSDFQNSPRTVIYDRGERPDSVTLELLQSGRPASLSLQKIAEVEQCTVFVDYPSYALYDWLQGYELYESYMQLSYPLVECEDVYPFNVTDVAMTLALNAAGPISIQAFIADLDEANSTPDCPYPGAFIETTAVFDGYIDGPGVYILGVDFEAPVTVYGPYFAGFYYACDMTGFDPGIAIDTVPYYCLDYNDWGLGLVDLASNPYYPFPGSIDLFSVGYHGSAPSDGTPIPYILVPNNYGLLTPEQPIWTAELADTLSYQGAVFERFDLNDEWVPFGVDFDGTVTLRDGINPADTADGWRAAWNPGGFVDTDYLIRATVVGTDTVFASDTITVTYRGTALTAEITSPTTMGQSCSPDDVTVDCSLAADSAQFGWRAIPDTVTCQMVGLDRSLYGDSDGDPWDGNHFYSGEFGEYYVGPAAVASLIDHWATRGYANLYPAGDSVQNVDDLVEWLATITRTRNNLGNQDDNLLTAAKGYIATRGVDLQTEIGLPPTWNWLLEQFVAQEATVTLAIAQPIGNWLTLAGLDLTSGNLDSLPVTIYDPVGGIARNTRLQIRDDSLYLGYPVTSQLRYVDLAVAIHPTTWNDDYTWWSVDINSANGLAATLPSAGMTSGERYLLCASVYAEDLIFDAYQVFQYSCQGDWLPGDADGDGIVNISDGVYIIQYIFASGEPPQPVLAAGDADCDGAVNITDVVYLINYIFASGPAPCAD
ncbi:MAG: dockerin type I repeat-containing protein [bacterium]